MSTEPPKYLCAKCFKSLQSEKFVRCKLCTGKFHYICTDISEINAVDVVKKNKNIVFNCNDCLLGASDLVAAFSALSLEVREIKSMLSAFINNKEANNELQNTGKSKHNTGLTASNTLNVSLDSSSEMSRLQLQSTTSNASLSTAESTANLQNPIRDAACLNVCDDYAHEKMVSAARIVDSLVSNNVEDNVAVVPDVANPSVTNSSSALARSSNVANKQVHIPTNNSNWVEVGRKKNRKRAVIGESENNDLEVVIQKKWVHLSTFKPTVTPESIIAYVAKYIDVSEEHMVCFRLAKKDADLTQLRSINFKLGISSDFFEELFKPSLWPTHVRVRPFHNFQRGQQGIHPA